MKTTKRRRFGLLVCGLVSSVWSGVAAAEPQLQGTPTELKSFLATQTNPVTLVGRAEVRAPAETAVLSFRLLIERESLREALELNMKSRGDVLQALKERGITEVSTPVVSQVVTRDMTVSPRPATGSVMTIGKSGQAISGVQTVVIVTVATEKQLIDATSLLDRFKEVALVGIRFESKKDAENRKAAIERAGANLNAQRDALATQLGAKLTPVSVQVSEGDVELPSANRPAVAPQPPLNAATVTLAPTGGLGEVVYTAMIVAQYRFAP